MTQVVSLSSSHDQIIKASSLSLTAGLQLLLPPSDDHVHDIITLKFHFCSEATVIKRGIKSGTFLLLQTQIFCRILCDVFIMRDETNAGVERRGSVKDLFSDERSVKTLTDDSVASQQPTNRKQHLQTFPVCGIRIARAHFQCSGTLRRAAMLLQISHFDQRIRSVDVFVALSDVIALECLMIQYLSGDKLLWS